MPGFFEQVERKMEGMPRKVKSMKLPIFRRAPRNPRDVSKGDTVANTLGKIINESKDKRNKGKESVKHPHVPTHARNTFPEVTAHQQRIVQYTDATSEISVGGRFMNGGGKYMNVRKMRS